MNIQVGRVLGFIVHSPANMNDIDFQIIRSFILLIRPFPSINEENPIVCAFAWFQGEA